MNHAPLPYILDTLGAVFAGCVLAWGLLLLGAAMTARPAPAQAGAVGTGAPAPPKGAVGATAPPPCLPLNPRDRTLATTN